MAKRRAEDSIGGKSRSRDKSRTENWFAEKAARVDDGLALQPPLRAGQQEIPVLQPAGRHHHRIDHTQLLRPGIDQFHPRQLRPGPLGIGHRDRIMCEHGRSGRHQVGDDPARSGLADIVGIGLEGQPEDEDALAGQGTRDQGRRPPVAGEKGGDLRGLGVVDREHGIEQMHREIHRFPWLRSAWTSFGKQLPPKPHPGTR